MAIEELLDYYFYRRVAHLIVPIFLKLRFTPNQITTLSLIVGLIGAFFAYRGMFILSAMFILVAIFFDCCDGQVARLTGKSSPLGRVMDGLFDALWVTALWLGIFKSGYFSNLGINIFPLMLFSSISMIIHCWRFDGIKVQYIEKCETEFYEGDLDFPTAMALFKKEMRSFSFFSAFLALAIAFQMYFFGRGSAKKSTKVLSADKYQENKKILEPVINLWSFLGEGHHNTLVIIGMLLTLVSPYFLMAAFWFILVPMNLWWFYSEYQWRRGLNIIS